MDGEFKTSLPVSSSDPKQENGSITQVIHNGIEKVESGAAAVVEKVSGTANSVIDNAKTQAHELKAASGLQDLKLTDRRIAVIAVDGYEQVELDVPVTAMKVAGAKVTILSLRTGRIRGVNLHEPGRRTSVDRLLQDASIAEFDGLFIPGGFINPDLLRQSKLVRQWVSDFNRASKPIASICHGPWVLISSGITSGRYMTSWPGMRDDVVNSGAVWLDQEVVLDRNLLTSRGPQDMVTFTKELVKFFSKDAQLHSKPAVDNVSAPPRNEPPEVVIQALTWLPHPSLRTALALGAVALGVIMYYG